MKFKKSTLFQLFAICLIVLFALVGWSCRHSHFGPVSAIKQGQPPTAEASAPSMSIQGMSTRTPVIMYHDIIAKRDANSVYFDVLADDFEKQMAWIVSQGITPISVDQLYDHLTKGTEIPANSIVLTFDDNYLGVYQNAFPILQKYKFPFAVFVHTNFVGDETGSHPKMNWDQLLELQKSGLCTIGGHTQSHPMNLDQLSLDDQQKELEGSKEILERHLGRKVDFMAYPNGKFTSDTERLAQQDGYKMAFAMDSGFAEESPSLYAIHRFEQGKLKEAWNLRNSTILDAPIGLATTTWTNQPVRLHVDTIDGLKIAYVMGGSPSTRLSDSRQGVEDFVRNANAVAGINGGFFAMASLYSTSNVMIGPSLTPDRNHFDSGLNAGKIERLQNRPVIFWGPKGAAIANFEPQTMLTQDVYRAFMPDMTDLFVGGAWIIHNGIPQTDDQMIHFASKDLVDMRRRVFFGWTKDGQPVAGASLQTCTTERLAQVAAQAGVQEAILLDSGFSTSLVYNGRIIVTGHTAKDLPSRPVPHAIVFLGQADLTNFDALLASAAEGAKSPEDLEGERLERLRRARERQDAMIQAQQAALAAKQAAKGETALPPGVTPPTGPITPPTTGGTSTTTGTGTGSTTGQTTGSTTSGDKGTTGGSTSSPGALGTTSH